MEKLSCKERISPPITEYPYTESHGLSRSWSRPQSPFLSPKQKDADAGHLTVQYNTTFFLAHHHGRQTFFPVTANTNDGLPNLSQDTLGEHFCSPGGLPSHARHHTCETQPMDSLVTAGDS